MILIKTSKEAVQYFEHLYNNKAIYVWGMNGEIINKSIIDKTYNVFKSATYNRAYYDNKLKEGNGRIGADCSGCMYQISGFDTTTQNYYNKCTEKNAIISIPRNKPCLVFKGKSTTSINHIGFYCGNGYVIEMKSSKANCVKDKLEGKGWKWYGIPSWIDYSENSNTNITSNKIEKCIDVSSYQGEINWNQVHEIGISKVVLKVIRKDLTPDKRFEYNYANAIKANVDVIGFYNYSYALTKEKAITDAKTVLNVLNGRKGVVWLDIEDKTQQGLRSTIVDIINEYGAIIETAGYEFGVYTGMSFYNSFIKPYKSQIKCTRWWIARYYNGYNKMSVTTNPNEQYNPKSSTGLELYAWQYTSSGQVPGISGNVDINVLYGNTIPSINYSPSVTETLVTLMGRINTSSSNLNIRSSYSSNSSIIGKYHKNEIVQLIAKTSNGWYRTNNGYISADYVVGVQGEVFNCSKLNIRSSATSGMDNKIGVLSYGDTVRLLKDENGWYKIQTDNNVVGYVLKSYIKILG